MKRSRSITAFSSLLIILGAFKFLYGLYALTSFPGIQEETSLNISTFAGKKLEEIHKETGTRQLTLEEVSLQQTLTQMLKMSQHVGQRKTGPFHTIMSWISTFAGILLPGAAFVAGIGALRLRNWARRLAVWQAGLSILFIVIAAWSSAMAYTDLSSASTPLSLGIHQQAERGASFFQKGLMIGAVVFGIFYVMIPLSWNTLVIWFFSRAKTKAEFEGSLIQPVHHPDTKRKFGWRHIVGIVFLFGSIAAIFVGIKGFNFYRLLSTDISTAQKKEFIQLSEWISKVEKQGTLDVSQANALRELMKIGERKESSTFGKELIRNVISGILKDDKVTKEEGQHLRTVKDFLHEKNGQISLWEQAEFLTAHPQIALLVKENKNIRKYQTDRLAGIVYLDSNRNGIRDDHEQGVEDVTVFFSVSQQKTNRRGFFGFRNLQQGYYSLTIRIPDHFVSSNPSDEIGFINRLIDFKGESAQNFELGIVQEESPKFHFDPSQNYEISGTVFADQNRNGIKDSDEGGYPTQNGRGMTLVLEKLDTEMGDNGRIYLDTDQNGSYSTENLLRSGHHKPTGGRYMLILPLSRDSSTPTTPRLYGFILNSDKTINFGLVPSPENRSVITEIKIPQPIHDLRDGE